MHQMRARFVCRHRKMVTFGQPMFTVSPVQRRPPCQHMTVDTDDEDDALVCTTYSASKAHARSCRHNNNNAQQLSNSVPVDLSRLTTAYEDEHAVELQEMQAAAMAVHRVVSPPAKPAPPPPPPRPAKHYSTSIVTRI
jgi:hypothetical protein